jgi:hypothetical protein
MPLHLAYTPLDVVTISDPEIALTDTRMTACGLSDIGGVPWSMVHDVTCLACRASNIGRKALRRSVSPTLTTYYGRAARAENVKPKRQFLLQKLLFPADNVFESLSQGRRRFPSSSAKLFPAERIPEIMSWT